MQGGLVVEFSFIKQGAIYKTRNTGIGNRFWGMLETRGMFTRILGNLLEDSGECSHFSIPGSTRKDSGVFSRRFREMFKKIGMEKKQWKKKLLSNSSIENIFFTTTYN